MRTLILGTALMLAGAVCHAQDATCTAKAAEKKLAGAAKTSFLKKCTTDAQAACETSAGDKKLAGAARNSFIKKCAKDAVGN